MLRPKLLSEAAATELVRSATDNRVSGDRCEALWQESGGNPFYLTELLRALEPSGTSTENVREGCGWPT